VKAQEFNQQSAAVHNETSYWIDKYINLEEGLEKRAVEKTKVGEGISCCSSSQGIQEVKFLAVDDR
jgi:hypothetical protein